LSCIPHPLNSSPSPGGVMRARAGRAGRCRAGLRAPDEISRQFRQSIVSATRPTVFNRDVAAFDKSHLAQALVKGKQPTCRRVGRIRAEVSDCRKLGSLGTCSERPHGGWDYHRAPKRRKEIPSLHCHSITSSAMASSVGGTARPSNRAVCRLIRNSNLVARYLLRFLGA
jgi:hypothetical protein